MRRVIWTQDFDRVRIERDDNRSAIRLFCVVSRRGNYGLMAQVDAVENADREEEWAAELGQLTDRTQDAHAVKSSAAHARHFRQRQDARKYVYRIGCL